MVAPNVAFSSVLKASSRPPPRVQVVCGGVCDGEVVPRGLPQAQADPPSAAPRQERPSPGSGARGRRPVPEAPAGGVGPGPGQNVR